MAGRWRSRCGPRPTCLLSGSCHWAGGLFEPSGDLQELFQDSSEVMVTQEPSVFLINPTSCLLPTRTGAQTDKTSADTPGLALLGSRSSVRQKQRPLNSGRRCSQLSPGTVLLTSGLLPTSGHRACLLHAKRGSSRERGASHRHDDLSVGGGSSPRVGSTEWSRLSGASATATPAPQRDALKFSAGEGWSSAQRSSSPARSG